MNRSAPLVAIAALLAGGLAVPAAAQPPAAAPAKVKNPNEIVCEKQTVLGSRLATKRKCLTRAQWEDQRRVAQDLVEGLQRGGSVCTLGKTC